MFESAFRKKQAGLTNRQGEHRFPKLLMAAGLITRKVGMSRIFTESGEAVPVTYLKVEPNTVVRTKSEAKDGYNAVVLGIGAAPWKSRKGKNNTRYAKMKEWQVETTDGYEPGTQLTAAIVPAAGATVTLTAHSKGRGFQGVIKRHGFSRGPETHGSHHHREPGSVGMKEWPGRVLKGKRMPGHMGLDQVTLRNCPVMASDAAAGIIAVKGPVPGAPGSVVFITFEFEPDLSVLGAKPAVKEEAVAAAEPDVKEEPKTEEAPAEAEAPATEPAAEPAPEAKKEDDSAPSA